MPNFLNLVCPRCGADDRVEIASQLWLRVTDSGTEPDLTGTYDYTPGSPAICTNCSYVGTLRQFEDAGKQSGAAS